MERAAELVRGLTRSSKRTHNRASSVQVEQQSTSSNGPGALAASSTGQTTTSKSQSKIPTRRQSSSSISSQTSSKKSSNMGLGKILRKTSKLMGNGHPNGTEKKTTVAPVPHGAPPTPPSSSRGTPSNSTISRFRSRDSRPGSQNSFHSLEAEAQEQSSTAHKIHTVTPPVSMLQLAENEPKEYFANVDNNSDRLSDTEVKSIPEETEPSSEDGTGTEVAKDTTTDTRDTAKETIIEEESEEIPSEKPQPPATTAEEVEVHEEDKAKEVLSVWDISKIEVDDKANETLSEIDISKIEVDESYVNDQGSHRLPNEKVRDGGEIPSTAIDIKSEQCSHEPAEGEPDDGGEESTSRLAEPKGKEVVRDMDETFEELVIPNGASTPKKDKEENVTRLHLDFNLDGEHGTFQVFRKDAEGDESEDVAGRRTIEAAKRTLEILEARNKPQSLHRDPLLHDLEYHSSSAIADDDDDVASVVSDFHHPRVSDAISKLEKDIETSTAVVPIRSRTTSYSSNSFHAGMGPPPTILVRTDSTASAPGEHKRPLSRSLSISSSFTVHSRSPSRNGERSLNSFFIEQNSPTSSHFSFSDKKKRGPSSVYSASGSNENLGAKYRFASPTLASSTREHLTKTEYEHILSEKDKPKPERPDPRKKAAASSAGEYVSKRIRVRLPGGGASTTHSGLSTPSREQLFNPDSSYMSLNEMKAGSPTPSSYTTTATQTESPYPSPPASPEPEISESKPPNTRLRRLSTSSRRSEKFDEREFQQSVEDAPVGLEAKVASLLSMFDEDARTVDELVGSLESSMSMLEREGRRSRASSVHSRMHSRAPSSVGSGVSRRSRPRSFYEEDFSDRSSKGEFMGSSMLSTATTEVDEPAYVSEFRKRHGMRDSPPTSPTPPRTPVDKDLVRKAGARKPFTIRDVVRTPMKFIRYYKTPLISTLLAALIVYICYYIYLVSVHRECGYVETYICILPKICYMKPYACY